MPSRLADEAELRALVGCLRGSRPRRVHADQGRPDARCRSSRRSPRDSGAAGDRRRAPAQQHQPARRVRRPRSNQRRPMRAATRCVGAVSCCPLAMEFTLHSPYAFEGLESWQPASPSRANPSRRKFRKSKFRDAVRAELIQAGAFPHLQRRVGQGARRRARHAPNTSSAPIARARAKPPAAIRSTSCSTSRSRRTSTRCSARCCSTPTRRRWARCCATPARWSRSRTPARTSPFFNDAGFGLHLLGHWVRELGVLTSPRRSGG